MTQKRLDIRDLPRDRQQFTGVLRTVLVKLANYVRKYPKKAVYLVELLEATLAHVKSNQEAEDSEPVKQTELTTFQKLTQLRLDASKAANLGDLSGFATKIKAKYPEDATLAEAKALVDVTFETLLEKHK